MEKKLLGYIFFGLLVFTSKIQPASTDFGGGETSPAEQMVTIPIDDEYDQHVTAKDVGSLINADLFNAVIDGDVPRAARALAAGASVNVEFRKPGFRARLRQWLFGDISGDSFFLPRQLYGWRPLHVAASHNDIPMMDLLLLHRADINAPGELYWPPLILTIYHQCYDAFRYLIVRGADVNIKVGPRQYFPLYVAVAWGLPVIVQELLQAGADPMAYTADGAMLEQAIADRPSDSDAKRVGKLAVRAVLLQFQGVVGATV
jgi:hypothetical protein